METIVNFAKRAGNSALVDNPPDAFLHITTHGSDWLWTVFSLMALCGLVTMGWGFKVSRGERTFFYISAAILATASVAYFSLASDLGATPILVEFKHYGPDEVNGQAPTRQIWYARYIDWTITTPLLLLELLLVSGLPLSTIFITVFFDIVMIICGLIGALVSSDYKWGYYTMGCVAMFYVFYTIYGPGLKSATHLGDEFKKSYLYSSILLTFLWALYPLCWGLCDGGNVISPDSEMIFYGILDLLAKPVFTLFHLWSMRKCNYSSLQLRSGKFSDYDETSARALESGHTGPKAAEAGVVPVHHDTTVNGATTTGLQPAPATAMEQTEVTQ